MKMQTKEIEQIKEKLVRQLSPEKIYLFGSFAEGTADEGSDVDIYIIVKDDTENLVDLTAEAYKSIRNVRSRAVDIIIGTESRFESRKNRAGLENEVMSKGVLLYG
ncbi:MAG: nucleotidyltransferase domain-containing protein [Victivallales bacterium]|nr:nucleotidyltransferase domain-containing protein [Victivallales bacterium]